MSEPSTSRLTGRSDVVGRRLAQLSAELGDRELPPVPEIPVPGRHSARPDSMRGRVRLGTPQLAVVSVVVALGLLVTAWWTVRSGSEGELVPAASSPVPAPALTSATSPTTSPTTSVVVDVAGKVRRPGIVVLPAGSRVVDALREAGGARPQAAVAGLNQARVLVDGEQILVGQPLPAGVAASAASAPTGGVGAAGALINLNAADQSALEELPGVGPVTAQAIVAWRTEHGAFTSVEELLEVDGIGDKTLADLAPHVTL